MIVVLLQPRLDLSIKVAEQRADVPVSFDFKETLQAVPMAVQISTLILQRLVAMSRVEFVLLLNNHVTSPGEHLPQSTPASLWHID